MERKLSPAREATLIARYEMLEREHAAGMEYGSWNASARTRRIGQLMARIMYRLTNEPSVLAVR